MPSFSQEERERLKMARQIEEFEARAMETLCGWLEDAPTLDELAREQWGYDR